MELELEGKIYLTEHKEDGTIIREEMDGQVVLGALA